MKRGFAGGILFAALLLAPTLAAAETKGDWEFNFFTAKADLDNQDPLALTANAMADFSGDGTLTNGTLQRGVGFNNDLYAGFRIGYIWMPYLETEFSYDRNHTGSSFQQTITDNGPGGGTVQNAEGTLETIFTAYQISGDFFPLAYWKTHWQPYVTLGIGLEDVDFTANENIAYATDSSSIASKDFGVTLPRGDQSFLISYGLGVKFHVNDNFALRADFRAKQYNILDDRRTDRELSLGVSFYAPGDY